MRPWPKVIQSMRRQHRERKLRRITSDPSRTAQAKAKTKTRKHERKLRP